MDALVGACLKGAIISHEYTSRVFTGFAVDLPELHTGSHYSQGQVDCLLDLPSVINVQPSPTYHLSSEGQPAPGPLAPERPQLMRGDDDGDGLLSASSCLLHQTTGVDDLHSQGVNGTGVTVALVDDGVDYLHPAFGGGLGDGFTVGYGQDLTRDGDGKNASDPFCDCNHHGTHVAGIIAGHDPTLGYVGAAPGVRLEVYRVMGCGRNGRAVAMLAGPVLEAVLAAYDRSVDVISMSLGFVSGPFPYGEMRCHLCPFFSFWISPQLARGHLCLC